MKNILTNFRKTNWKIIAGAFIISVFFVFPFSAKAAVSVSNIKVTDIEDGSATISWRTSEKTKGIIYIGTDENNPDKTVKYNNYKNDHKVSVSGLEEDETYIYKIVVISLSGEETELFSRSFSTKDMEDTKKPKITDFKVAQSTYQATLIKLITNEETRVVVNYGRDLDDLDKSSKDRSYDTEHEIFLYKLDAGKKYYIKVMAYDRDDNYTSGLLTTVAYGKKSGAELKISDVEPDSYDADTVAARSADISFETNLVAKSRIKYGTNPDHLSSKLDVSDDYEIEHDIKITNLEPLTTYYFKIEAYDSFYGEDADTEIMSFTTCDVETRFATGSLVRDVSDDKIYLIIGDTKAWIKNPEVFLGLGFKSEWVENATHSVLEDYKEADSIDSYKKHPSGTLVKYADSAAIYLIQNGKKCPIASAEVFLSNDFSWDRVITISSKEKYSTGDYIS